MSSHRRLRSATIALLASPLAFAGCDRASASASRFTTVDTLPTGTVHVTIAPEAREHVPRWKIVEDLRIGAIRGPGPDVFGDARAVEADGEGRIYVLDAQAMEVRVFAPDGSHIRTVGREGGGPGEFQRPNGLALGPDDIVYVYDQANQRLTGLLNGGDSLIAHPLRTSHWGWVWDGVITADGRLHDRVYDRRGEERLTYMRRYDLATAAIDSLPLEIRFERPPNYIQTPRGSTSIPFSPSLATHVDREGHVWFATTDMYRLHRMNLVSGDTLLVVDFETPPVPVPDAERDARMARIDSFVRQTGGTDWDRSLIPTMKPLLQQLEVDDRGRLWVRMNSTTPETPIDIFDAEGRLVATTSTSLPFLSYDGQLRIQGDHIYAIVRDELDVQYVVRARIEPIPQQ